MSNTVSLKKGLITIFVLCIIVAIGVLFSVRFLAVDKKEITSVHVSASQADSVSEKSPVYHSPVDFDSLTAENSDIYSWLDIPDTDISYPVFQHGSDDDFYLRKNINKRYDHEGVLFTQCSYNGTSFDDPVTVIYGHNINRNSKFGALQDYYSQSGIKEHSQIVVYTPDKELHYTVFAAVVYDDRHILYNYDFTDERTYRLFFNDILSARSLESAFAENASVQYGDKVLILSTCVRNSKNERFLVCAKLTPN